MAKEHRQTSVSLAKGPLAVPVSPTARTSTATDPALAIPRATGRTVEDRIWLLLEVSEDLEDSSALLPNNRTLRQPMTL